MLIKNVSLRPWNVLNTYILPGETAEVVCTEADVAGNPDLEIVQPKAKLGRPAQVPKDE